MTKYICIEGVEGVGKTTQTQKLVDYLRSLDYKVLQTKEPGTAHSPLTMELRNIMLNAKYEPALTPVARELISQAIRSIHLEKVITPAQGEYDFIVQDRGILSGLAYGEACGNDLNWLMSLTHIVVKNADREFSLQPTLIYDKVILLTGNVKTGLDKAVAAKQEFEAGDAIEMKGLAFMQRVNDNMSKYSSWFKTVSINIDGKSIDDVFTNIIHTLDIRSYNDNR